MKIILDTETTGLPLKDYKTKSYYDPVLTCYYNSSRLVQLAYLVLDDGNNIVSEYSSLVKPNGQYEIKNKEYNGGIDTKTAQEKGNEMKNVLHNLLSVLDDKENIIIGHNIEFDIAILSSEAFRINNLSLYNALKNAKLFCTMKNNTKPFEKYPKLVELYKKMYPDSPKWNQIHDALDDCKICFQCYLKSSCINL